MGEMYAVEKKACLHFIGSRLEMLYKVVQI